MITCYLLGGLGNQLFQICNIISYSIESGNRPAFAESPYTIGLTRRPTYWNTFFLSLRIYVFPKIFSYFPILREKGFTYNELPINKDESNLILSGYFQSYKYFEKHKTEIFKMICLEHQKNEVKNRMQYNFDFDNTISLHFRIGDYKLIQDKHPLLTKKYYANAIRHILMNIPKKLFNMNILYFCEERDLFYVEPMINELKEEFKEIKEISFIPINPIFKDYEQMLLMSCCRYNIIANSTFSWWGAYFNSNQHKIICYPSQWFGPNLPHSTDDLFPDDWIKIT